MYVAGSTNQDQYRPETTLLLWTKDRRASSSIVTLLAAASLDEASVAPVVWLVGERIGAGVFVLRGWGI
jgi:hypothetical protein